MHTALCGRSFIVPHSVSLVKNFFQGFLRFFSASTLLPFSLVAVQLLSGTFISYHRPPCLVKRFFQVLSTFSADPFEKALIARVFEALA